MVLGSIMIFCTAIMVAHFSIAQIHSESHTIPIISDEHGNLCFGDPFEQNETAQEQSPTDKPQLADEMPAYADFSQKQELSPLHLPQPQPIETFLIYEEIESLSADQPVYLLMCNAEVLQNTSYPEECQGEASSIQSQGSLLADMDAESTETDLGTLLAYGDLGPLSVDEINVEPFPVYTDMESLSNDTYPFRSALTGDVKYHPNMSSSLTQMQTRSNSRNEKNRNLAEKRSGNMSSQTFSGSSVQPNSSEFFIQPDHLKHSVVDRTGENPFKCKQLSKSSNYPKRRLTHNKEKLLQCEVCQERFGTPDVLQTHRRIHTENKPFKCDFCEKEYSYRSKYLLHRLLHTGEKPFQCDMCPKQFRTSGDCQKHRRTHTGEMPYKCDRCGKEFSDSSNYHKHQLIHTGEKPFQCDMCPKQFRTSGNYQKHRLTHTGEKPFRCDVCQKQFNDQSNYRTHRRKHTGEKPFQCDICAQQFRTLNTYQAHRRIHTGEKPFQCDICSKQFGTSDSYRRHRRTHTGEKVFKCNFCEKEFSDRSNYLNHRRIHTVEKS